MIFFRVFTSILSIALISAAFIWNQECPKIIDFQLYTQKPTPYLFHVPLSLNSAKNQNFKTNVPIKVILPGYLGGPLNSLIHNLIFAYLNIGYHVITTNYDQIKFYPNLYMKKSKLGKCIADLILTIIQNNPEIQLEQFHIIGASFGAQIAAQISRHLGEQNKLDRITGLDPTWILFGKSFTSKRDRLNRSHANFVDIVHTDIVWAGCAYNQGHYDFYLNGGRNQPKSKGTTDHSKSMEYFTLTVEKRLAYSVHRIECNIWKWLVGLCKENATTSSLIFGAYSIKPTRMDEGSYVVYTEDRKSRKPR